MSDTHSRRDNPRAKTSQTTPAQTWEQNSFTKYCSKIFIKYYSDIFQNTAQRFLYATEISQIAISVPPPRLGFKALGVDT